MTTKDVGDRVNVRYLAYLAGAPTTATMTLTVTAPDGTTSTPSPTPTSPNIYDASFLLTQAGVWYWTWVASGTIDDTDSGQVTAVASSTPTYSTLARLKSALNMTSSNVTNDDLLQLALEGASRAVEEYCDGRRFYLDRTATARTFSLGRWVLNEPWGQRVYVNDIGSTAGILVEVGDGTTWTTLTDCEFGPDNALSRGKALETVFSPSWSFGVHRLLRLTARWGWPQVPVAVENATLLTATRYARRPTSPEGVAGSADWGLVRIPNVDPDVQAQLAYLKTVKVA